ncbi:MAG: hypothetical protein ACM3QS_16400 [Bacteroidota bacterium]
MNKSLSTGSRIVLTIIGVLAVMSLSFQALAVPGAVSLVGTWDRLNPGSPPEHEVLRCGGNQLISCVYDKHPEPLLNFTNPPEGTIGFFRGQDVTTSWTCPAGFGPGVCANVAFVASGVTTYTAPDGSQQVLPEDLVVSSVGGQSVLYMYFKSWGVACPWYRSFGAALAANPFPLPYNGTDGGQQDCFAP